MSSTEIIPVRPSTGEVIDVNNAATDQLAAARLELEAREKAFKQMRAIVDGELRRRMNAAERRMVVAGDYEVRVVDSRTRDWDGDDLEAVLRLLLEQGRLGPQEVLGIISHPAAVNGTKARELLLRTSGNVRAQLEACFDWKTGRERIEVIESRPLIEGE